MRRPNCGASITSHTTFRYVVEQVRRALQLSAPRERRRTVARLDKHEVELVEAAYRKGSLRAHGQNPLLPGHASRSLSIFRSWTYAWTSTRRRSTSRSRRGQ